jgi:hypothetical protein
MKSFHTQYMLLWNKSTGIYTNHKQVKVVYCFTEKHVIIKKSSEGNTDPQEEIRQHQVPWKSSAVHPHVSTYEQNTPVHPWVNAYTLMGEGFWKILFALWATCFIFCV